MHILAHQYHPDSTLAKNTPCVLSKTSLDSLFHGTLNDNCKRTLGDKIGSRFLEGQDHEGALDWSTAMAVYMRDNLRSGRKGATFCRSSAKKKPVA
jgi:hypothetical protein